MDGAVRPLFGIMDDLVSLLVEVARLEVSYMSAYLKNKTCRGGGMVDAVVSNTTEATHAGSSPAPGTNKSPHRDITTEFVA